MSEVMWFLAIVTTIATIIGGIAVVDDYFFNRCVKNFCVKKLSLIAYFRQQRLGRKQKPIFGTVPLDSPFYVERPPIASDCYENIGYPDALIRVKAPRHMGKSSLLERILNHAERQEGCQTVFLSFREADNEIFSNLDQFLYWFCGSVTEKLGLPNKLEKNWQGVLGSKSRCSNYFEKFLLTDPLVLGLDEVDMLFEHQAIADDFFALLRVWHEEGKNKEPWKKLRMVITHSQEDYVPLKIYQSPFDNAVGMVVELPEFTQEQVRDLARQYQQALTDEQIEQLVKLVGGHPYLVQVALYQIAYQRYTLEKILKEAHYEDGPYSDHLRRHRLNLKKDAELVKETKMVMSADGSLPVREVNEVFRLRSMGLVKVQDDRVMPLCDLYRRYFNERL
jgi:hypothetical protein